MATSNYVAAHWQPAMPLATHWQPATMWQPAIATGNPLLCIICVDRKSMLMFMNIFSALDPYSCAYKESFYLVARGILTQTYYVTSIIKW